MQTTDTDTAAGLQRLREIDYRHVWHPYTNMERYREAPPVVIERAEGSWLYDVDGNRYLDGVASLWANVHGHNRREINEALVEQIGRVSHTTLFGLSHVKSIELARRLCGLLPAGLTRIHYSESGSTAVEAALRIAYLYWYQKSRESRRKRRFIALGFGYHGDTNGVKSLDAPHDVNKSIFGDMLFPVQIVPSPYCGRCEIGLDPATCGRECLLRLQRVLESHAHETAAVVLEPLVQGAGGIRTAFDGYLAGVRALCDRHDVLMVADEVATGFGKTGTMFACEQEGVVPDILCMAKGLSGGYLPLAATAVTEEIYRVFSADHPGLTLLPHGHTYSGNPLACAAALASLDIFAADAVLENLQPKIARLSAALERFKTMLGVGTVRQRGFMAGIELVSNGMARGPRAEAGALGARAAALALERSVYIRQLGDVVVWMPPLSLSDAEMDFLVEGTFDAIKEAIRTEGGAQ